MESYAVKTRVAWLGREESMTKQMPAAEIERALLAPAV